MTTTGKSWQHLLPIMLLSAAGFTVLTTEFIIVGLLPAVTTDLHVSIPQAVFASVETRRMGSS
jgi:predicted MFS family arabinose efflux permease